MQALSEQLQNRIDSFTHRFGEGAERDERNVYVVRNLSKPEHEQHDVIVQGSVIDRFIFNGFYKIDLIGQMEHKSTTNAIEGNRKTALEEAERSINELKAALSPNPVKKVLPKELSK